MSKNLLLMSSSRTPDDTGWLHHAELNIKNFLGDQGIGKVTLVPYAGVTVSHQRYTEMARERFGQMGFTVDSVSEGDPEKTILKAEAILVGGGNTFMLTKLLHEFGIMSAIRDKVENAGVPYLGWSAGSVVAGPSMQTTNDMPIVKPKSFDTLGIFPININPHYRDPVVLTEEMRLRLASLLSDVYAIVPALETELNNCGETRDDRLNEFIAANNRPIIALREGSILHVQDTKVRLEGTAGAQFFEKDRQPTRYESGAEMDFLLNAA